MAELDRTRLHQIALIAIGALAVIICVVIVEPFLTCLLAATALAILCYPVHVRLLRRIRRPNVTASISVIWVTVIVLVPATMLAIVLTREAGELYQLLADKSSAGGGWTEWSASILHKSISWFGVQSEDTEMQIRDALVARFTSLDGVLLRWGQTMITNVAELVVSGTITLFALFFLFRDGPRLKRELERMLPLAPGVARSLFGEVGQSVIANFYGIGAVALVQGTLTGLIFLILGLPSAVLWGAAAALFSMIPVVGTAIIWAPAAVVLGFGGSWAKAAIMVAFGTGVIGLSDNFIRPYIISERVNMHPLVVFVALLGGAQAFGFLGLFIGPAAVSLAVAVYHLLEKYSDPIT